MKYFIENFLILIDPFQVKDGYRVTEPIEIGVSFTHDDLNQVSNVNVICKIELLSIINWVAVRASIGDIITEKMVDIIHEKQKGKYVSKNTF